jgi:hypothetical protein
LDSELSPYYSKIAAPGADDSNADHRLGSFLDMAAVIAALREMKHAHADRLGKLIGDVLKVRIC